MSIRKSEWYTFMSRAACFSLVTVACSSKYTSGGGNTGEGGEGGDVTSTTGTLTGGLSSSGGAGGWGGLGSTTGVTTNSNSVSSSVGGNSSSGGVGGTAVDGTGGTSGATTTGGTGGTGGTGTISCDVDQRECQGTCIAVDGCCGNEECPSGESCQDNACTCNQGSERCEDLCIPETDCCDDADCADGAACMDGQCLCPSGTHQCGDSCASDDSVDTCGVACDEPCVAPIGGSVACNGTACVPSCPSGEVACFGECIDENAVCEGECPDDTHECTGVCLSDTSLLGCGNGCTPCPVPANGSATCDGTSCDFACADGFARCEDGCIPEGACCEDDDCGTGVSCIDNQCSCTGDTKLCDGECIDELDCCDSSECQEDAVCNSNNTCQCDSGFQECNGSCIPNADCCGNSDCGSNEVCSGGSCVCNGSSKECDGVCISNSACCGDGDCDANEVCESGACSCDSGFMRCSPSEACISDDSCCDDGDCSGAASCDDGECTCDAGYYGSGCDYYFTGLGFLSGHTHSEARGVSADGSSVVGASRSGAAGAPTAFRWRNGTRTSLGVLSGNESIAYAASSNGDVVVGDAKLSNGQTVGFRWAGSMAQLEFAPYGTYSRARDISDDGSRIVGWGDRDTEHRGLIWTNQVVSAISSFDPLYFNAVTPDGSVYGGKIVSDPMIYTTSSTQLGLLNGYSDGELLGLTASGSTRGVGFLIGSSDRAVRWTLGGDAIDLGTLSGASRALAVSADGSIVVGTSGSQAFIWDSENGIRSLATVLDDAGVNLSNWVLQSATGVSANGKTIAGYGTHGGTTEAFVAVMP